MQLLLCLWGKGAVLLCPRGECYAFFIHAPHGGHHWLCRCRRERRHHHTARGGLRRSDSSGARRRARLDGIHHALGCGQPLPRARGRAADGRCTGYGWARWSAHRCRPLKPHRGTESEPLYGGDAALQRVPPLSAHLSGGMARTADQRA